MRAFRAINPALEPRRANGTVSFWMFETKSSRCAPRFSPAANAVLHGIGATAAPSIMRSLCFLVSLAAARPALESVIEDVLRAEAVPLASPAPEPEPQRPPQSAALAVAKAAHQGPAGTLIIPLDPGHRARALSHDAGSHACYNDCPHRPGIGSITGDNYCDDGAASTAYCADPTGSQYPCEPSVTDWCPFGHDCEDCGPRRVENICTCCAVRKRLPNHPCECEPVFPCTLLCDESRCSRSCR